MSPDKVSRPKSTLARLALTIALAFTGAALVLLVRPEVMGL